MLSWLIWDYLSPAKNGLVINPYPFNPLILPLLVPYPFQLNRYFIHLVHT
jgi:hypothetical protein